MTTTKRKGKQLPVLHREAFQVSRLLDYFSKRELVAQVGHAVEQWPLVVLKELVDNALDACEEAGIAPVVAVTVDETSITVADNGSGIPPATVEKMLDYRVRVSSREAYISPTRGAQGNAAKTLIAMPFVLSGTHGRVEIAAQGMRHNINVTLDRIRQEPVIDHQRAKDQFVKNGTSFTIHWPPSPSSKLTSCSAQFLQVCDAFALLNPHLSLTADWFGERYSWEATTATWAKWQPHQPTSPHWYGQENLERFVAACIAADAERGADRTVREFVAMFDGLAGTAKQRKVLEATGLSRRNLSALRLADGLDAGKVAALLAAMKANARKVKPKALGIIGEDHVRQHFASIDVDLETFRYRKIMGESDDLPWIVETAFAWCPDRRQRRLITGANWSPALVNPFRELGTATGLDSLLEKQRAGQPEPVLVLVHLACPRAQFADRGKATIIIGGATQEGVDGDEE